MAYYIPFQKNGDFIGRREELLELTRKLVFFPDYPKVSIVGLGGTGKTQVALQFAYMVKEILPEFSIFWLPAISMESFEQACTEVAKALHIPQTTGEDVKELVKRHLSGVSMKRWLIVLDNADNPDTVLGTVQSKGIVDYLPENERGITIYTTRTHEIAEWLTPRRNVIELGHMDQQDAEDFFKQSLTRKDLLQDQDSVTVKALLDELTYLPLAIRQATAYLNINKTFSIAEYLHLLQNTEQAMNTEEATTWLISQEFNDDTRYKESANAVAMTLMVSFSQIRERHAAAADLLVFISCVGWKAIPRSLLLSVQPVERMQEAIDTLCRYSFLAKRKDDGRREDGEEWYDMHRLVHLAIRIWTKKHGDAGDAIEQALQHVAAVFPSDHYENQAVWRAYLPHAGLILEAACGGGGNATATAELSLLVGACLTVEGRIREAVKWLEESYHLRTDKLKLKEDHPDRLRSECLLAKAYVKDGQVKKAVVLLEHAVAVLKNRAVNDQDQLASQHSLAEVYLIDGQVKRAVALLEHVVAVQETMLAENHPNQLASQQILARAFLVDGQVKRAVVLLEHVVAVQETMLAEDHCDRLSAQHELARAYRVNRQFKRAVVLLEHVVAVQKKILAEDHPNRLATLQVLGGVYRADGQVKKAVALLEPLVAAQEMMLAEDHRDRLGAEHELARAYHADGQVQRAVVLLQHVVEVKARSLSDDHPSRFASEKILKDMYRELAHSLH